MKELHLGMGGKYTYLDFGTDRQKSDTFSGTTADKVLKVTSTETEKIEVQQACQLHTQNDTEHCSQAFNRTVGVLFFKILLSVSTSKITTFKPAQF